MLHYVSLLIVKDYCEGFPMLAIAGVATAPGAGVGSLQGKNPWDVWLRAPRKHYGDFGVAFVMRMLCRHLCARRSAR